MPDNLLKNHKHIFLKVFMFFILSGIGINVYSDEVFNSLYLKNKEYGSNAFTSHAYHPGNIKHIIVFKYKSNVTPGQKENVIRKFINLQQSRRPGENHPYIINISTGLQSSGEKLSMGFEQAFIVTFQSEGDRNYYVGEPVVSDPEYYDKQHAEFKRFVGPLLANDNGVLVFDFTDISHNDQFMCNSSLY